MKKIVGILLILVMTLSLTSCGVLEEFRNQYAAYSEDHQTITYKGQTYVLNKNISSEIELMNSMQLRVCESDVPVLLSDRYGDYGSINDQKTIIIALDGETKYYVLESEKEYFETCLENMVFSSYYYDSDTQKCIAMDEEHSQWILDLLKNSADYPDANMWSSSDVTYEQDYMISLIDEKNYIRGMDYYDMFYGTVNGEKGIYLDVDAKGIYLLEKDSEKGYFNSFFEKIKEFESTYEYEDDYVVDSAFF